MTGQGVTCVVPALDAAPSVGGVVTTLRATLPGALVVVVDDGSTDATGEVARAAGAITVRFDRNRGKGAALRAGIAAALDAGSDVLVTIDADGQHDPEFAVRLVGVLTACDLAIGARARAGTSMPLGRRLTNRLSSIAMSRCLGQPVVDSQSGFRAMRAAVARTVRPSGDRYEFETEFLILAATRGFRLAFVPVPTRYGGAVPSRFRAVQDSARIVRTLWRYRAGAPR